MSLLISDIPGDDPGAITSGPTIADASTIANVRDILARRNLLLPPAAQAVVDRGEETPKPGSIDEEFHIVAAPSLSLQSAALVAKEAGFRPIILGDTIEGEAREAAIVLAGIAKSVRNHGLPVETPAVLLSGGETTVSIGHRAAGRGGRNTEFQLSLALALGGTSDICAIACDTDGIDGSDDAAGAIVTPDTLMRGTEAGVDPRRFLPSHDSYSFFDRIGDLVRTGPTFTNVNGFRAIVIA